MTSKEVQFSFKLLWSCLSLWTIGIVFVLDQITKWFIRTNLNLGQHIPLLPFLEITRLNNKGAAFGMFHNSSVAFRAVFFGIVTIICIYLLTQWLGKTPLSERFMRFSLAMTLGGAFGNLFDRVFFGKVTDFIHVFYPGVFSYPSFNVADSAISVGITFILFYLFVLPKIRKQKHA